MSDKSESDIENSDSGVTPEKKKKITKRLTKYNTIWERDHEWLSMTKNEYKAFCRLCKKDFSVSHGGLNDVLKHSKGVSHIKIVSSRASNSLMTYFSKPATLDLENAYKIAATEICSVYHTVKHSLSYNSMDCYHKLLPMLFSDSNIAKKIMCGRTKSEAIVRNILATESQQKHLIQLRDNCINFSLSTDASNKGNRKMYPICIRYFSYEKGVQNMLVDFIEKNYETADDISNLLCETLQKYNLSISQITAYSADNTNVNFGCTHSVYVHLKSKNQRLLKANCSVHILHNMCKFGCDKLEFDVETLILKIHSHFSHSAKRRAHLIGVFESEEIKWVELLRYVNTRFLSLSPAIERILKVWPALKSYFTESNSCPRLIEKIFETEEEENRTLAYLYFIHNVMSSFEILMQAAQSDEMAITEMHTQLCLFRTRLQSRLKDKFYGFQTKQIINKMEISQQNQITCDFTLFYQNCIKYLEDRYDFSSENLFGKLDFINMKETVSYESVENAVIILDMTENISLDQLYEEINLIKPSMEILVQESKDDKSVTTAASKWQKLFKLFPKQDIKNILKLVSYILSVPTSNCFVERVFSQMNLKWSDVRNRCSTELVKSELFVQFNFDFESCVDFYKYIKDKKDILQQVTLSEKYKTTT